jgi:hypothetical protein
MCQPGQLMSLSLSSIPKDKLSEREVYHGICHIVISKIVKFRKDYQQTGDYMNF